jgi:hypothetical protein
VLYKLVFKKEGKLFETFIGGWWLALGVLLPNMVVLPLRLNNFDESALYYNKYINEADFCHVASPSMIKGLSTFHMFRSPQRFESHKEI